MTNRPGNYFDKKVTVDTGIIESYDENLDLRRAQSSNDKIVIEADQHSHYVNGTKRLETKTKKVKKLTRSLARVKKEVQKEEKALTSNVLTYQGNNSGHGKIIISYSTTTTNTVVVSACDSYDWSGVTYDSTGLYTNIYSDVNGCDSTVTLDLTINNTLTDTVIISSCGSYLWDGVVYDSSCI